MLVRGDIVFEREFIRRVYHRDIISAFGNDLNRCCSEIARMINNEGVFI